MSHSAIEFLAASDVVEEATPRAGANDTRAALELLVDLGMRILDGDASALLGVAPALGIALERLDGVHRSLQRRARDSSTPFAAVLTEHAEHRRQSDLRELDRLSALVSQADDPSTIGRAVVVAALVLLANLDCDERCYGPLSWAHQPAHAA